MRWLGFLCRLALGGVFLFASWDKILHPEAFAKAVDHYHLVPYSLLHPFTHGLPILEAVVGLGLVLGIGRRGAALLAVLLDIMFMAAITSALMRGLDISCGCFHTDGGHAVGLSLLARDAVFLLLALPPLLLPDCGPTLTGRKK